MNENDQTNVPPPIAPSPVIVPPTMLPDPKPFVWWLRKLFACNPFYLVSAALLLYGCYRVSIDAPIFDVETARLLFNYTSVQFYEIILVITAIFLARRSIWYDSTLLVGLENLLVFVPFILISQAALMDTGLAQQMCLVGAAVAAVRFAGLKKNFHQLNLPGRLLAIGSVMLLLNVTLPLIYRHFGETKISVHIDSGPAYEMNECTWLLILPAVLALVNFVPEGREKERAAESLLPQHRRLPLGLYTLWFLVTGVHVYALDYIYQFDLRGELLAPGAWVLAWTLFLRVPAPNRWLKYALTLPPLLVPILSTSPGGRKTFLILAALNLAAYAAISLLDRSNRLARHLVIAAGLLFVAGMPAGWLPSVTHAPASAPSLAPLQYVAAGLMAYLIIFTALMRNPKLAILGSIIFGSAIMAVFHHHAGAGYWALQGGFIFFLLHSLRWNDQQHTGANLARMLTASAWVLQSFAWMNADTGRFWMPFIPGAIVLGACLACRLYQLEWKKSAVPVAALFVIFSGPCHATIEGLQSAPAGLLAVIGSFLLFGFGTIAALTRHLWHHNATETGAAKLQNQTASHH